MTAKTLHCAAALLAIAALAGCAERRADNFRRQGDALYALERYDEAIPYYARAAELNPQDARVRSSLGRCYAAKGDYAAAAEQFELAVALDRTARADHAKNMAILRDAGQVEAADALSRKLFGEVAAAPAAAAAAGPDWHALWKRAALHELLEHRAEFAKDEGLAETLFIAALLTGNRAVANEIGAALDATSPLRAYHEALVRGDVRQAVAAAADWPDAADAVKPLRDYALGYALALGGARARAVQAYSSALKNAPDQAAGFYAIAQVFANSQMPQLAAKCLQNLLARGGENLPVRVMLYDVLKQAGLKAEARRAAEAMHRIAPEFPDSVLALAEACLDANEGDLALTVLHRGLEANPGHARLRLALAGALLHKDRAEEALVQLENLQGQPAAARTAGFAHARLANWAQAEIDVRDSPASDDAVAFLKAAAAANQGRYADARALVKGAPEADEDLKTWCEGWAWFRAGLYRPALDVFEPALESREPTGVLTAAFTCIARGCAGEERVARAKQLAERHAGTPEAWVGLAGVMEAAGDAEAARAALETAATVAPDSVDVLKARARMFEQAGETDQAVAALRRLAELAPNDAAVSNNLAYLLLTAGGDAQDALRYAERAAGTAGANASVLHTLGLAQFRAGKIAESQATLRRALELRPLEPTLLLDYGQALISAGQDEEGSNQVGMAVRLSEQLGLEFPRRAEAEKLLGGAQPL